MLRLASVHPQTLDVGASIWEERWILFRTGVRLGALGAGDGADWGREGAVWRGRGVRDGTGAVGPGGRGARGEAQASLRRAKRARL